MRQLLGNGRSTLHDAAAGEGRQKRPQYRLPVERRMVVEVGVFDGERRLSYGKRDILERDHRATFLAVYLIEEYCAGAIEYLCRFRDAAAAEQLW